MEEWEGVEEIQQEGALVQLLEERRFRVLPGPSAVGALDFLPAGVGRGSVLSLHARCKVSK